MLNIKYTLHKVRDFYIANPLRLRPLKRLDDWLKLWEAGEDSYDYKDDDKLA
jgi:hypothetical protein